MEKIFKEWWKFLQGSNGIAIIPKKIWAVYGSIVPERFIKGCFEHCSCGL